MIKGWTTDPNANEAYRPSSRTACYSAKRRQSPTEYHPESDEDTGEQESADSETEEYRLRLIVLPGDREKSGTEGESVTGKTSSKDKSAIILVPDPPRLLRPVALGTRIVSYQNFRVVYEHILFTF